MLNLKAFYKTSYLSVGRHSKYINDKTQPKLGFETTQFCENL
tara:strand:+ start:10706 stop:10831 length:126 start_codon:yes stop_codon:yes gene_type:complete